MAKPADVSDVFRPSAAAILPHWSVVLRALREARSLTQDGWAAYLGVGRRTVQRWEQGLAVPDATARRAILAVSAERGLYRRFDAGPLAGITVTAEWLGDLLAAARMDEQPPASFDPLAPIHPFDLPAPLTSLVGREQEIATIAGLLETARLMTLTGPGGTGKTRLALAVAEAAHGRFPDGAVFVDLAALSDPGLVLPAVAQRFGVREGEGRSLMEVLAAYLRGNRLLLVLDNFEQVVSAAPAVRDLLSASPEPRVLVTSRIALRLTGEREFPVPPLAVPEDSAAEWPAAGDAVQSALRYPAVALFMDRARDVRPAFALTEENAAAVASICRRLDGLPLAIELAAARIRVLAPRALLARLEHRLPLLTGGGRGVAERQQTLRGAIQWSYDLLPPAEQTLFCRLAVFAGGCTLEAAEAVCADPSPDPSPTRGGEPSAASVFLVSPLPDAGRGRGRGWTCSTA